MSNSYRKRLDEIKKLQAEIARLQNKLRYDIHFESQYDHLTAREYVRHRISGKIFIEKDW